MNRADETDGQSYRQKRGEKKACFEPVKAKRGKSATGADNESLSCPSAFIKMKKSRMVAAFRPT